MKGLSSYHLKPIRTESYMKSYAFIKGYEDGNLAKDPDKLKKARQWAAAALDRERGRYDHIDRITEEYVKTHGWNGAWWRDKDKVCEVMRYINSTLWKEKKEGKR